MSGLEKLQTLVAKALIALVIGQLPILLAIEHFGERHSVAFDGLAIAIAFAPAACLLMKRPIIVVGQSLAIGLVGQAALLVFLFKGHPWQIEMHSISWLCWRCWQVL